jgi:hypothetical protein
MPTLKEDIRIAADWIAGALVSSGYRADFSPSSLWAIERFFEVNSREGSATRGGLLEQDLGKRLFGIGSYIGEVVRRALGGEWVTDDSDPEGEINAELLLPGGIRCWPVQRAMKRLKLGAEDSVVAWAVGLGLQVGPSPQRSLRPIWKRIFG